MNQDIIRVASTSVPNRVAGAIAKTVREKQHVEVQAIGADAVNRMLKSVALAQQYVHRDELAISCIPSYVEVTIDGQSLTAINLLVMVDRLDGQETAL
ncbi:MAG: stage V sporulation protein S [Caldilineaceae bacterium]|nr:stage V sporulation protein S [Caldilineaceae bacterium]